MPQPSVPTVASCDYLTDPLLDPVEVVGPAALTLYAAIDSDDTNWMAAVLDVGGFLVVRRRQRELRVPPRLELRQPRTKQVAHHQADEEVQPALPQLNLMARQKKDQRTTQSPGQRVAIDTRKPAGSSSAAQQAAHHHTTRLAHNPS